MKNLILSITKGDIKIISFEALNEYLRLSILSVFYVIPFYISELITLRSTFEIAGLLMSLSIFITVLNFKFMKSAGIFHLHAFLTILVPCLLLSISFAVSLDLLHASILILYAFIFVFCVSFDVFLGISIDLKDYYHKAIDSGYLEKKADGNIFIKTKADIFFWASYFSQNKTRLNRVRKIIANITAGIACIIIPFGKVFSYTEHTTENNNTEFVIMILFLAMFIILARYLLANSIVLFRLSKALKCGDIE